MEKIQQATKIKKPTRPLADVNVLPAKNGTREIVVHFMPDPDQVFEEGDTRAFLALDGSVSLKKMYGYGGLFGGDPNYVQGVARKIGQTITLLSRSGKASAVYWAVNTPGDEIEAIGELDEDEWGQVTISGPTKKWGRGTKLLPAIKYGYETVHEQSKGSVTGTFGVIITDGIIEDERACFDYCRAIGKELDGRTPEPFKLVLIGIGAEVDQGQLTRLDNMFEGTGIKYDLWGSGLVQSMQTEDDILAVLFGELMTEETLVAESGRVELDSGQVVKAFQDGLPGMFRFNLPENETGFIVRAKGREIRQDISEVM